MKLDFSNVSFDGDIRTRWDVVLRVVGDFSLWVRGKLVYKEVEFCLVEFAIALAHWLADLSDLGPDLSYTSLESEIEGLVRFRRIDRDEWQVTAGPEGQASDSLSTAEMRDGAVEYVRSLRAALAKRFDVINYIEDARVRDFMRRTLEQSI